MWVLPAAAVGVAELSGWKSDTRGGGGYTWLVVGSLLLAVVVLTMSSARMQPAGCGSGMTQQGASSEPLLLI